MRRILSVPWVAKLIYMAKTAMTVSVALPITKLQQHLPASLDVLCRRITGEIDVHVHHKKLGYYPAFDYFRKNNVVEAYLLNAFDETATLAMTLAQQDIVDKLVPVFSRVEVVSAQCLAYAMPPVRVSQPNAKSLLVKHFTPNKLKFELLLSLIQRQPPEEKIAGRMKNMVYRWLDDAFETTEINSARFLAD